ncbi:hypothetical protein BFP71_17755 [Roseivirga misakiensis]|uniref:Sensor of ECF-type sigma factor n=2 Tax=Roseivirga misakiensis TaxID=1563681 RepID=A0A1E5T1J1_9BACT|nr:hypothetical protein BFP71_17755 [Roseivirga misakiensis]
MISSVSFAQGGNRERGPQMDREKLQAARIAYLTNRLELDTETAKVFWPLFTEYDSKKHELGRKYGSQKRALFQDGTRNVSDENADKMLEIYLEQKQAELNLEKEYLGRFKKVLSLKQVWRVIRFDSDFRRDLFERASRNRDGRKGPEGKTGL